MMHNNSRKYRPSNSVSISLFLSSSSVFDVANLSYSIRYLSLDSSAHVAIDFTIKPMSHVFTEARYLRPLSQITQT